MLRSKLLPLAGIVGGAALLLAAAGAPAISAQTVTPTATTSPTATATVSPTATTTASPTATTTASPTATSTPSGTATPGPTATPNPSTPHDSRYFSQTGFRIDNDTFWNYFNARGGITTFGYPTSRTFQFLGFTTQFFQRRVMQIGPDGSPRLLNLFDPGLFPYTNINGSTFPAPDPSVTGAAPVPGSANYGTAIITFNQQNAPDSFNGHSTNFYTTFLSTVTLGEAFPNGNGNTSLLPGFDLEMWGAVTSHPTIDPANNNFIYLRFQRGIMMYDASTNLTQGVLLGDYFKDVITGQNIPADLNLQAQQSSFYQQYNDAMPNGLNRPALLPGTNMQYAFDPQ
ncbi:MAG: hypothetical protein ACYDAG_16725 [Chloroflexota bacterium]